MGLTVPGLKRAYTVRMWRDIFANSPYVAVLQLTGGRSWGRTNMRARVLADGGPSAAADARYAVPWAARAAAQQTRFIGLAALFRAAPCAVVFGADAGAVLDTVERALALLDGGVLLGGRFGADVVAAGAWEEARALGGEDAVRAGLLRALAGQAPPLARVLDGSAVGLARAVDRGGGAARLLRAVDAVGGGGETVAEGEAAAASGGKESAP